MKSQYHHCLQILTVCSKINFLHNIYSVFLIFSKLTILHHFVTYLSNDPPIISYYNCYLHVNGIFISHTVINFFPSEFLTRFVHRLILHITLTRGSLTFRLPLNTQLWDLSNIVSCLKKFLSQYSECNKIAIFLSQKNATNFGSELLMRKICSAHCLKSHTHKEVIIVSNSYQLPSSSAKLAC